MNASCPHIARRHDDTFEITLNGLPYHVTAEDERYTELTERWGDLAPGTAALLLSGTDGEEHPAYDILEDHRGLSGWVNGQKVTVTDFGSLPEGWSDTPPLAEAKAARLAGIARACAEAFAALEAPYPASERAGWPLQESEARALIADPDAAAPLLTALAGLRGENREVLAAKVLAKAKVWREAYARLVGRRGRHCAAIEALTNVNEVLAWSGEESSEAG